VRAVVIPEYGDADVLAVEDVDDPVPGPDEIVVAVRSTALNRADLLQRMGLYPDPSGRTPEIPGLEYAGVVSAVGTRVHAWREGDKVMGIESGGCHAELVATHERQAMRVPDAVSLADAGAIPEVFVTAWDALVRQGGLTAGRWALVHAGASGVGTAAIQLAKAMGAHIAVTCSSGKADRCRELGADLVLERSPAAWRDALRDAVPDGVDVVLDVVGGEEIERNLQVVRTEGRIIQVGVMGGGAASVNAGLLLAKRVHWIGTTLRSRPLESKVAVSQQFQREVAPWFSDGTLVPVIDRRLPLNEIAEAHRVMESNANVGKIVLDVA